MFNVRRDYLAAGLTLEVTPLLQPSARPSSPGSTTAACSLLAAGPVRSSDNLTLVAGVQTPIGRSGTEFGGLPLTPAARFS